MKVRRRGVEFDWKLVGTARVEKYLRNDARLWLKRQEVNANPLSKSTFEGNKVYLAHCSRCHGCGKAWRFRLIFKYFMAIEIKEEGYQDCVSN